MNRPFIIASLLVGSACTGKKDEERVAPPQPAPVGGAQPATPAPNPGSAGVPAEAPPAAKLTCDTILAKPLRDKYLPGATITDVPQVDASSATCRVLPQGSNTSVELAVTCHAGVTAGKDAVLASVTDMQELAGVGAPARMKELSAGGTQIMAWDTDSSCQVIGILPQGVDVRGFMSDLLAQLPAT